MRNDPSSGHRSVHAVSRRILTQLAPALVLVCGAASVAQAQRFHSDRGHDTVVSQTPDPLSTLPSSDSPDDQRLLELLRVPVSGSYQQEPLETVIERLNRATGGQMRLDLPALADASIVVDTPVTCEFSNLPLRQALVLALKPLDLSWTISDGIFWITTPDKANSTLVARVYPVRDLIGDLESTTRFARQTRYTDLADVISTTIAPTTWDEVGGPGSMREFQPAGALVVSQTYEAHEQIAELLAALRRTRDVQYPSVAQFQRRQSRLARGRRVGEMPAELETATRWVVTPSASWSVPRLHE